MEVVNLFPTPVCIFNLNRELTSLEKDFLVGQPKQPNLINQTSIETYLLNNEILKDLRGFIDQSLNDYFKILYDPVSDCSLKITQSWANYSEDGLGHHIHTHQNSIVSGVFYVQTSDSDKIKFYKPFLAHRELQINPKQFNPITSSTWWLPAKQCSLVLFPSTLQHSVDPNSRKETRISLSFNSFFSGVIGSAQGLNELIFP